VIAVRLPAGNEGPSLGVPSLGAPDVIEALVRWARAADVRMTMVAGAVLFEQGTGVGTPAPVVASGYRTAREKLRSIG
jgi:hypothetical protein